MPNERKVMDTPYKQRWAFDRPIKEIWDDLSDPQFVPADPYYGKLVTLAELKTADINAAAAKAMACYTKWLMALTAIITLGTLGQAVFAILSYCCPHSH
ncbi:MAG: hypothetical protein ACLQGV_06415 [Bryobacteraceae bacterium]